jgi:hypothetical protein
MNFTGEGNPRVTKQCEHCSKSYRTRNPDRCFCSSECRNTANAKASYHRKNGHGVLKEELQPWKR